MIGSRQTKKNKEEQHTNAPFALATIELKLTLLIVSIRPNYFEKKKRKKKKINIYIYFATHKKSFRRKIEKQKKEIGRLLKNKYLV